MEGCEKIDLRIKTFGSINLIYYELNEKIKRTDKKH